VGNRTAERHLPPTLAGVAPKSYNLYNLRSRAGVGEAIGVCWYEQGLLSSRDASVIDRRGCTNADLGAQGGNAVSNGLHSGHTNCSELLLDEQLTDSARMVSLYNKLREKTRAVGTREYWGKQVP
jgi:hypothetical protein